MSNYNEPWKENLDYEGSHAVRFCGIVDKAGSEITLWEEEPSDEAIETERRIIACVNFCAGKDNESLAEMKSLKEEKEKLDVEIKRLKEVIFQLTHGVKNDD